MNIYITHNLATIRFKFIISNSNAKQYRLSLKLQLSRQTSNFLQYGSKIWAEIGLCKQWLEIYTMRVGLNIIVLLHVT